MNKRIIAYIYTAFILMMGFSCKMEPVEVPVTGIELNSSSGMIEVGLTDTLQLVIHPQNTTNKHFYWSSSDLSIAEVDPDGVVRGISPGTAVIRVTADNGITVADTVHVIRWTSYARENVHARPVAVDSQDQVWSGGNELTRIIGSNEMIYTDVKYISAIAAGINEDLWFGTHGSGIWKFDGNNWTNYTTTSSNIPYNSVNYNSMTVDPRGNLWMGTSNEFLGTGVTMFDGNQWHIYNSDNGIINNNVMDISIDNQGNKWFVTNQGINCFDDTNWISYNSENTGTGEINYVFSIAIDNENNKWFGSYKGALKFDGSNWTVYNSSNSNLKWNFINDIAVDRNNNIWFATEMGVSRFDGTNWLNYISLKELGYNVRAIAIDSKGIIWLGTSNGILKLEV
jgi:streptogramin lyase